MKTLFRALFFGTFALLCLLLFASCGEAEEPETETTKTTQTPVETTEIPIVSTETPTEEPTEDIDFDGLSFKIENGKAIVWGSKRSIKKVVIPAKIAGVPVTEIADKGFKDMVKIESLTLPEGLLKIGESAFENCYALTSIVLPESLEELGERAFSGCNEVTSITIGHNLKVLPQYCFSLGNLTELVIPEGVEEIYYAYVGQLKLTADDLTVTLPRSLKRMAAGFDLLGCKGRLIIKAPDVETWFSIDTTRTVTYDNDYDTDPYDPLSEVIPAGTPVTQNWAKIVGDFDLYIGDVPVTEVLLPEGVTEIPAQCYTGVKSLVNVIIPEGVTAIGDGAFKNTGATEVIFPSTLKKMGDGVFEGTPLDTLTIPGSVEVLGKISGMEALGILELEEGVRSFAGVSYCPALSVLSLPASLSEVPRSMLATDAYVYCLNNASPGQALYDCTLISDCPQLNTINLAEGNPLFALSASGKLRRKTDPFAEYKALVLALYPDEAPEDAILLALNGATKETLADLKEVFRIYYGGELPENYADLLIRNKLINAHKFHD